MELAILFAAIVPSSVQGAEQYPTKPIRVIVPFPPGGPIDVLARIVMQKLSEALGVSAIIDNRPGANGIIGTELVARSPRDGYTMLYTAGGSHSANVSIYKKLPYNSLRDFAPVTQLTRAYGQVLVVHPSMPIKTVKDLVALAKAKPGRLNYASAGLGSTTQLAAELLFAASGIKVSHIPYKGGGPALNDVLSGHIEMMFPGSAQSVPYILANRVRAIAISGAKRAPVLPQVPTFEESGYPGVVYEGWQGLWFPAGTPRERVQRIQTEVARIIAMSDTKARLNDLGLIPVASVPEEFAAFIERDVALHARIVKAARIEPQ